MTEGKRGVRGDTGLRGDEGEAGQPGPEGSQGAKGEPGRSVLARKVTLSFWAVAATAFAVLGLMGWAIKTNRDAIQTNQDATKSNTEVIALAKKVTAETDVKICTSVEALRAAIREAAVPKRERLLQIQYYRDHPAEIKTTIAAGKQLATAQFPRVDCTKLPTIKGSGG